MKELLRIERGSLNHYLAEYCLSIYEGDVMYIQSFSDQSLHLLIDVLMGKRALESGKIYFREKEISKFDSNLARKYGIYTVTFGMEFVENMSIAENLKPIKSPFQFYSVRKNKKRVQEYLDQEEIERDSQTPVWKLTEGERKKLGVLRAKLFGSHFVILDMTSTQLEDRVAEEICRMVQKMQQEGMTFLILSSRYTPVAESANRVQYLSRGYDMKEWQNLHGNVREKMAHSNLLKIDNKQSSYHQEQRIFGLYVYSWAISGGIWDYLIFLKEKRPDIWEKYICAEIPEYGEVYGGNTVIIPRESGELLLSNLSIKDNLTITAGKRIATGKYGFINRRLQNKLSDDFYKSQQFEKTSKYVSELTRVQRKILSVARWELVKPEVIILERPYSDIDVEEATIFNAYLMKLVQKGIKIICFVESQESLTRDHFLIINI